MRKVFWFWTRVKRALRGAVVSITMSVERTRKYKATTRSARAKHAINREASGRYAIDFARIPSAIATLAKELLEIEATGDRARGESWFAKYDKMPASLQAALAKTSSVPVDIDPVSAFADQIR